MRGFRSKSEQMNAFSCPLFPARNGTDGKTSAMPSQPTAPQTHRTVTASKKRRRRHKPTAPLHPRSKNFRYPQHESSTRASSFWRWASSTLKNTPTAWLTDPSLRRFALPTERNHTYPFPRTCARYVASKWKSWRRSVSQLNSLHLNYSRSSGCTMCRNEWPLNRLTSSVP